MYGNDQSFTRSLKEEASELVGTVYGIFTHCRCIIQSSIFNFENALINNSTCSAQVFKRTGCHLKRAHLVWLNGPVKRALVISALNGRKRAQLAR